MSNIPLKCLLGAFAVVSITGCDVTANKGFCQKTDKGYEICIKEENISLTNSNTYIDGMPDRKFYRASGVRTSLAGSESHFTDKETCWGIYGMKDQNGNLQQKDMYGKWKYVSKFKGNYVNQNSIVCIAARHFRKL